MKWINENGIYFPTSGDVVFLDTPGNGIFQVSPSKNPMDKRLGLLRVSEKFIFDFKIYDVGCGDIGEKIKKVWSSPYYKENNKNLGVIFNGVKGTGKTLMSKLLCNDIGLPVILVDNDFEGQILPFITNLNFECIIFIDEAEKMFNENPEILLKLIDGAFNVKRKLYLLTTNKLTVDENLIDRPGRIRYIQEFGNLSSKAINECIEDNLKNLEYKDLIVNLIDRLQFSTIDILKNIIEEVNILGPTSIESDINNLNIPIASYRYEAISFIGLTSEKDILTIIEEAEIEKNKCADEKVRKLSALQFLREYVQCSDGDWDYGYNTIVEKLQTHGCKWVREISFKSSLSELKKGIKTDNGKILDVFNDTCSGFFLYKQDGWDDISISFLLDKKKPLSLYNII